MYAVEKRITSSNWRERHSRENKHDEHPRYTGYCSPNTNNILNYKWDTNELT